MRIKDKRTCRPLEDTDIGEAGCPLWKADPPSPSQCRACPLVGMFCRDCADYKICPKAGLPKISPQSAEWLAQYFDHETLKLGFGYDMRDGFSRDIQAHRLISNEVAKIRAQEMEQIKADGRGH